MIADELPILDETLARFCQKWRVRRLSLFGSAARGNLRADSDIDVLVLFDPAAPWSSFDLVAMRDELAALVGREVDLIEEDSVRNPFLRANIQRDQRVIYAA
jgi:hypothetical protein